MAAAIRPPDDHTLLAAVPQDAFALAPSVEVDGVHFVRKVELHITVFDGQIGKTLDAAIARRPTLGPALEQLVARADFGWTQCDPPRWWRVQRDQPSPLQTIVAEVDAPGVLAFFAACARELGAIAGDARLPTWQPPPPHVTLYTSDRAGKQGIGLHAPEDLEQAARRGQTGDASGLRAFRIAPITPRGARSP
jgi:hypothetical protein